MNPLRLALGVALVVSAGLSFADPPKTELLSDKSRIGFVTKQMGVPVEGRFGRFSAQVAFDPRRPEGGSISLSIDTGSAALGIPQSDAELPRPAWLDTAKHPSANFRSTAIKGLGNGQFEVVGRLTIKGATQDVVVPVAITQAHGESVASGSFTLQRLGFKVGEGEWTDTSMIANDVEVRFKFTLTGLGPL
ncbi:YceI family protein [Variovorax sp. J22P168]|uniref:YceI family protein n=1 Tax=Variovorax jilinensis TaxID=3053513 RepID=UPI0025752EA8|nr:YceI family protein [Variovorax sp. J22P168]MDM0014868.1 YceI family protein [Variovorax sp. J22P168]